MKPVVAIPLYNAQDWIGENIALLKAQTWRDFRVVIVDDLSTDRSAEIAAAAIDGDSRFQLIRNHKKSFALGSAHTAICAALPDDEDVIIIVDGDDRLAHERAIEIIVDTYRRTGCWLTHGSFTDQHGHRDPIYTAYDPRVIERNRFRENKWLAHHPRTYKYKLWRRIHPQDMTIDRAELRAAVRRALLTGRLRNWYYWRQIDVAQLVDPSGQFVRKGCDKAPSYPMLEMAGRRIQFIDEILYIHRVYQKKLDYRVGGRNSDIPEKWFTRCIRDIIVHKARYQPLERAAPLSETQPTAET